MSGAYYNEIDPYAAVWLRNLIAAGHIAPGDVDTRSITEVQPDDLAGYTQCHFFAGIGGWSLALRLAGWPDDRPVWTGSCPCQPFSAAGKRKGVEDHRHLWPEFNRLIGIGRPAVVFGEQVASKDGREWLAGIRADLEALGYAVGAADLCSPSVGEEAKARISYEDNSFTWERIVLGAPHIRQRLFWVADAGEGRRGSWRGHETSGHRRAELTLNDGGGFAGDGYLQRRGEHGQQSKDGRIGGLDDATGARHVWPLQESEGEARHQARLRLPSAGCGQSYWSDFDLIPCTDGKARRVEPGTFPLAHGVSNRVGRLRAYGNAINPWVAAEFIAAHQEARAAA